MELLEIIRSGEYRSPDELLDAIGAAEGAVGEELVAIDRLRRQRDALVGGPDDPAVDLLDTEIRAHQRRVAQIEGALAEGQRQYQAATRRQPHLRPGGPA